MEIESPVMNVPYTPTLKKIVNKPISCLIIFHLTGQNTKLIQNTNKPNKFIKHLKDT